MTVMSSPRAPAASSTGRSLAPVPTSLTGLGTVRTRPAPGSTAGARAPGRSLGAPGLVREAVGWRARWPPPHPHLAVAVPSVLGEVPSGFLVLSPHPEARVQFALDPGGLGCRDSKPVFLPHS